uniref:Uncharacterized protein n=1 Tax=Timema poppense TaxID=170557 RepID=A0A7R9H2J4_TIMPO|nr:unnamed protein product [Timema poppensis]
MIDCLQAAAVTSLSDGNNVGVCEILADDWFSCAEHLRQSGRSRDELNFCRTARADESALVSFLRTCTGRSNHPPYCLASTIVHVLSAVCDAFPTVAGAKKNSSTYWLAWRPLSLTFSCTNGKFPFLTLDKASSVANPYTIQIKQFCLDSLSFHCSYFPLRLTLPGHRPTAHRNTRVAGTPSLYPSTLPIGLYSSLAIPRDIRRLHFE